MRDSRLAGRKWHSLASALHRETGAWMMVPTEDAPERVRRRHVVLRPRHLSPALVSNSLLKSVTAGDKNFAHAEAVVAMGLESCIDACPVGPSRSSPKTLCASRSVRRAHLAPQANAGSLYRCGRST